MQIEADASCGCVGLHVELFGLHREYRKQVAVRMIALGWTWAAVARCTKIGASLQCSRRQHSAFTACAFGKHTRCCRDIHYQPVPEARAGWCIGVIAGDGETLCSAWCAGPLQVRRLVTAGAAKSEISR